MIRRLLEAGPVGEEELDMIKMLQEFCNRLYTNETRLSSEGWFICYCYFLMFLFLEVLVGGLVKGILN